MRSDHRLPSDFQLYKGEAIINFFNHSINETIEQYIKGKSLFSQYNQTHFLANIWWDTKSKRWYAEVWVSKRYTMTHFSERLQDLADEIDKYYTVF